MQTTKNQNVTVNASMVLYGSQEQSARRDG